MMMTFFFFLNFILHRAGYSKDNTRASITFQHDDEFTQIKDCGWNCTREELV